MTGVSVVSSDKTVVEGPAHTLLKSAQRGGRSYIFSESGATFCLMLYLGLLQDFLPRQKSVHIKESWMVQ